MHYLPGLFAALALAFFLAEGLKRFGVPRVTGEIFAGILLGISPIREALFPAGALGEIREFADIGVVLLFFFVGLDLSLRSLGKNMKESAMVGILNSFLPLIVGVLIGNALGLDPMASIVLGIVFSMTSSTVTFDLFEETGLLKSRLGIVTIGSEAISEFIDLMLISVLLVLIQTGQDGVLEMAASLLVFVIIIGISKIVIIPKLLEVFEAKGSERALFRGALIITLLMGALAGFLGISVLIGAFVAGMLVRRVLLDKESPRAWEKNAIAKSMNIIAFGFFIPIFFVFTGLSVDISDGSSLILGFALSLAAIAATTLSSALGVVLSGRSWREGILVGLGITPKGDTDIVVASLALSAAVISPQLFSVIILVALFTTIIAPILFRLAAKIWLAEISARD